MNVSGAASASELKISPPASAMIGNLVWGPTGVWACFEVEAHSYRYLSTRAKMKVHSRIHRALNAMGREALLLGIVEPYPWNEIEAALECDTGGAAWKALAERQKDQIGEFDLVRRRFVVALQLPEIDTDRGKWNEGIAKITDWFGTPAPPSPRDTEHYLRHADDIERTLSQTLTVQRATPGLLRWVYVRTPLRGLAQEPSFDPRQWEPTMRTRRGRDVSVAMVAMFDYDVKEGGSKDDENRPNKHRYVRVDDTDVSYQSFACVSDMPHEWLYPGGLGEWLQRLDNHEFAVDWAQRIQVIPNADAQRAATKQARELAGQWEQYEGDPAGAPPGLAAAVEANQEERAMLASSSAEKELWVTTIVSCAADELVELEARMNLLQQAFAGRHYGLPRPTGGQAQLLVAMLPGSRIPRVASDYRQYLLSQDTASSAPFTSDAVGDPSGMCLGLTSNGGLPMPSFWEPSRGPANDKSGCAAFTGSLGSGKSFTMKRGMTAVVVRGGQLVLIDRTPMREYVRLARYLRNDLGARVQIVQTETDGPPPVLLDVLRVFSGKRAETVAIGFLGVLTGYSPMTDEGAVIEEAVRNVARAGGGLVDVIDELDRLDAGEVARRVRQHSHGTLGELAFGTNGRQLDLDADVIVFSCPGLSLPDRAVQTNQHLAEQMTAEHYESMGLLYLMTGAAQQVCFANSDRFSLFSLDEVWSVIANLQGEQLVKATINDGRKHNAAVWVGCPHPAQLGPLADLIKLRFVYRQEDKTVDEAARFLGGSDDDQLKTTLGSEDPRDGLVPGECFVRDLDGRIGRVQTLAGETRRFAAAAETNPARVRELSKNPEFVDLFAVVDDFEPTQPTLARAPTEPVIEMTPAKLVPAPLVPAVGGIEVPLRVPAPKPVR